MENMERGTITMKLATLRKDVLDIIKIKNNSITETAEKLLSKVETIEDIAPLMAALITNVYSKDETVLKLQGTINNEHFEVTKKIRIPEQVNLSKDRDAVMIIQCRHIGIVIDGEPEETSNIIV